MTESLASWNDGTTKKAILEFVAAVTDESGPQYVPPAERVAAFDNDGTLWVEKPAYIQLFFAIQRLKEMAAACVSVPGLMARIFLCPATADPQEGSGVLV